MFCKKVVLKNFANFTEKRLCQGLFFNKVAGLRPVTLLKKRPWHRCFPVNFIYRTPLGGCFCIQENSMERLNKQQHSSSLVSVHTVWVNQPLKRQSRKMVKHTQTNRRQFADDLFECV